MESTDNVRFIILLRKMNTFVQNSTEKKSQKQSILDRKQGCRQMQLI